MKKSKAIQTIVFFLVLSFLGWSLPKVCLEDINQDKSVDLKDAILAANGFAASAENPTIFQNSFGKLFSTLQIVAKHKIQSISDSDEKAKRAPVSSELFVLKNQLFGEPLASLFFLENMRFSFSSYLLAPEPYPPKIFSG